ncbi:FG-GAP-like repeat-containing protein, partial [Calditrichota bacterium]
FCFAQIEFEEFDVATGFVGAYAQVIDMDGDGDIDVVASAASDDDVSWFENDGAGNFEENVVTDFYDAVRGVFAIDMDGDEDIDLVTAGDNNTRVDWWENDGDMDFTQNLIRTGLARPLSVYAADVDSDGDMDVISVAYTNNSIFWYENDGEQDFTEHAVAVNFRGPHYVMAADLDQDEDMDILAAGNGVNNVTWWENDGEEVFTAHVVGNITGPKSLRVFDVNRDGFLDVLAAATDTASWFENDGEQVFTEHVVVEDLAAGWYDIHAADLDADDDIDIIASAYTDDRAVWCENTGDEVFDEHTLNDNMDGALTAHTADIDSDDDLDIVVAAYTGGYISWFANSMYGPPGEFELVSPRNRDDIDSTSVTFSWDSAENDEEGDTISYELYLDTSEDFENPQVFDADTSTSYTIENLEDDTDYWWKVLATDLDENTRWSEDTWTFSTYVPEPPDSFSLFSPDSGAVVTSYEVVLTWNSSVDPDPDDEVEYELYISFDPEEMGTPDERAFPDTTFIYNARSQRVHYWTVCAVDDNTEGTWADQIWSFDIDIPEPPGRFDLLYPSDDTLFVYEEGMLINLVWENSTDPDPGDVITYNLSLEIDQEDGGDFELHYNDLADTTFTVDIYADAEIEDWTESLEVIWQVDAISEPHSISCHDPFTFFIAPEFDVDEIPGTGIPVKYQIASLYPNPFNPIINIRIGLPAESFLKVTVFNILGQSVAVLAIDNFRTGWYNFTLDGVKLSSGIYYVNAKVPGKMDEVRKVVLIR